MLPLDEELQKIHPIPELSSILLTENEFVILDIETTGTSLACFSEVIEIGAVKIDVARKKIIERFSTFVRPAALFNLPAKTTEITNIVWDDVKDAPYIEDVLPALLKFIGKRPVVAHNANFDWKRFLVPLFLSVGVHATNPCICSMKLAKFLWPELGTYNLAFLTEYFGHKIKGQHRAYVDATWTAGLFLRELLEFRQRYSSDAGSLFGNGTGFYIAPDVKDADFDDLVVYRVSPYAGLNKKDGMRVFVRTSFGVIVYSARRDKWTVRDIWTDRNAPAKEWGEAVLRCLGKTKARFVDLCEAELKRSATA